MQYWVTILNQIHKTSVEKFPDADFSAMLKKCIKETEEALLEPKPKRLAEYADIFICWAGAAQKDGWTPDELYAAIQYKDAVNQRRRQAQQPDGTYQHISEG